MADQTHVLPVISQKQLSDLANQILQTVQTTVKSLKPSTADVQALTQASQTLAYVGLSLPLADAATVSRLNTQAALAKSSIEDITVAELEKSAVAAEALWGKVVDIISEFASTAISAGLTIAVGAI